MEFMSTASAKTYFVKLTTNGNYASFLLNTDANIVEFKERVELLIHEKFNIQHFNLIEAGKPNNENESPIIFSEYGENDCISDIFKNCCFYITPVDIAISLA